MNKWWVVGGMMLGVLAGGGWWAFWPVSMKDEPGVFVVSRKLADALNATLQIRLASLAMVEGFRSC